MSSRPLTGLYSALATVVCISPILAPTAAAQEASLGLEEIVVTARKTEERLIDAPLSITAFSADDIEKKGFTTLEDVARSAPGVQYSQQGGQIPGRFTSAIRFRGMNVNSDSPSLQLGSLFVDGIYVLGGTQSIPYDDVERIEVIKGPQSATYGRSTFGGAINYITRTPSLTEYSGKLNASGANYGEADVSASFEGPVVADKMSFRVGARYYTRGALFNAGDGGGLGEETSKSAQLALYFKPTDAWDIKLRAFHAQDEDGPSTGGLVQGWRNDSCTGKTISTSDPLFPSATPMNYICGAVPEQGTAIAANGSRNIIDTVTTFFVPQAAVNGQPRYVIDNIVNRAIPAVFDVPTIDHVGLIRTVTRFSLSTNYEFAGGYTATFQGGINELKANWIRSFGLTPLGLWWSRDPQDSEDESFEFRIASPQDRKLKWLVGVNKYDQTFLQSGSGGDAIWLCADFGAARPVGSPCGRPSPTNPTGAVGSFFFTPNSAAQNTDKVSTEGIFASVSYDITDAWTASLEGRYSKDETQKAILTTNPFVIEEKQFSPRAIIRWQPTEETNVYASYAKGFLPPSINAEVARATPRELAQYNAGGFPCLSNPSLPQCVAAPTVPSTVAGDELDMYEIGWKQQFWDRRAQINLAVYWAEWKNQKGRSAFVIQEDCGSFAHGGVAGATAANGCANGPNGLPAVAPSTGLPFVNTRNANVGGTSTLKGVEFEGAARLTENWDLRLTATWAQSEYDDFIFNFVTPIAGFQQMAGNSNARFPEWSGSIAAGYTAPIANSDWTWFANTDLSYVGKTYVDESNLAYCKSYSLANLRVGGEKDGLRVEGFVRNLFDDDSWAACARWTDFDSAPTIGQLTTFQGVAVTPQVPRQYGIRVSIKF
jgi:iron complex outermembrane receptor protein